MSGKINISESGHWFWTVLCAALVPVAAPWLIFKVFRYWNFRRKSAALQNKVVVITGASSGLGEALAHEFYKRGCRVVLAARRTQELERVKTDLLRVNTGNEVHPPVIVTLDLSDFKSLSGHVEHILGVHGHIDILVNNGGMSYRGLVENTGVDVDMKIMHVNYLGQVALTKAVLPSMLRRGCGHIVAVSSVQGRIALPHRSAYAASKHALQAFCDSLRAEVKSRGICVTVVSPGYVRTNLSLNALRGDGSKHAQMDASTESGYQPEYVSHQVLRAVLDETKELEVATIGPRLAILLRTLCPNLYFYIMAKRAQSTKKE